MAFDTDDPSSIEKEPGFNQQGVDTPGFLGSFSDFVLYGVYNGAFAKGPPDPTLNIDITTASGSNFMPAWRFVQSSNTNITAKQVRDTASPSGSNFRFTFASGAAADAAFAEQIVDIGGSRSQETDDFVRAIAIGGAGNTGTFDATLYTQYLTVDGVPTGSANSFIQAVPAGTTKLLYANASGTFAPPPTNASRLRIRVGVKRGGAANGNTGTIDFAHVRRDIGKSYYLITDLLDGTQYPGGLSQQNANLLLNNSAAGTLINLAATGDINLVPGIGGRVNIYDSAGSIVGPMAIKPLAADVSKSGTSFTNVTGLTFPVVTGHNYTFTIVGTYSSTTTNNGLAIAYNHPGGTARGMWEYCSSGPSTITNEALGGSPDTATGSTTTDATGAARFFRYAGWYRCTSDGTFALRYARQGAGAGTIAIQEGTGGWYTGN